MKIKRAKLTATKGGSGSSTFRYTIPSSWVRKMGLGEEIKDLVVSFDGQEISIRKGNVEMKEKIFVGGYYDDRIFEGEIFEGKTLFGKNVDTYTLEEALKLHFVEPVMEWYEEQEEKEWENLSDDEKIKKIEEYTLHDDIAGLMYFGTTAWAEQKKEEILKEIEEIEKESDYVGKEQNSEGIYQDVYKYKDN